MLKATEIKTCNQNLHSVLRAVINEGGGLKVKKLEVQPGVNVYVLEIKTVNERVNGRFGLEGGLNRL